MHKLIPLSAMPLDWRHWYVFAVASMEQLIGAALSTIVGIMIPLILLLGSPQLTEVEQGILGASGLLGIALGGAIIGRLMDRTGYLFWFRLCPLLIAGASVGVWFSDGTWALTAWLFVIGFGVGGGYSLDSGYISEIMPEKWESFFVGLAKASCSLGFIGGAAASYLILLAAPRAAIWHNLVWFIAILGLLTFILRIRWYESPGWLMEKGETARARQAARDFFGPDAEVVRTVHHTVRKSATWGELFRGENLKKVMLSGVTWACEGLGVYGFGVFLPILVMALGLQGAGETGIPKIMDSVRSTIFINLFIAAGFALGLAVLHRINLIKLMGWGFALCALALGVLLAAHQLQWPVWISFLSFVVFETALNAGPHLVTFIIPSKIYSIQDRGAGMGIATMLGKVGAILGVFFMPVLLGIGGIACVLLVSIAVQAVGAAISFIYGKELKLL